MQGCNGCIEKERMGLLEMKAYLVAHIGDTASSLLDSWVDDTTSNCCSWNRIKCTNITTGHVSELSLNYLNYYAQIPNLMLNVSLFRPFEELHSLDLSVNIYEGWIPNEGFPSLKKLENLNLSYNSLNRSSIIGLKGLTSLRTLDLSFNYMDGLFSAQGNVHFG
ncbi:Leucine-rich repeat [Sesbania bispinosa]|nr:Leucine-rich repeat [Sesbania bispinosa]